MYRKEIQSYLTQLAKENLKQFQVNLSSKKL